MSAAIALRSDFTGPDLRRLARRTEDARQARRLLALAEIYDGGSRSDAARIGDVGLQIIRDWVLRFNAEGPGGLIDRQAPGPKPRLTEAHRQALVTMIENGPIRGPRCCAVAADRSLPMAVGGVPGQRGQANAGSRVA